ncbi:MAG: YibE/F family protein [Candidatus Portnoybacteria bacterium]|nr:YibE/F family protein [Candidatus Portnoybacteria bacterium]
MKIAENINKIACLFLFALFCSPIVVWGQESASSSTAPLGEEEPFSAGEEQNTVSVTQESFFEARVLKIIGEKESIGENGDKLILQTIRLRGLEGEWENKEFISEETEINTSSGSAFREGDRVQVSAVREKEGRDVFYVTDFIRREKLYLLAAAFLLVILLVGRWRGFRAILGLAFSFFVILKFIIPKILNGENPLYVSLVFSFLIVIVGTYLVYGFNKKSSISILGISLSVAITGILSVVFTNLCRLSGFAQEETLFITVLTNGTIDLKGLLLAGFIIGALGVLDDLAISQVSAVRELKDANPNLSKWDVYKRAMRVGIDHISSMVNTLFLAYAGAALPLLLLFTFKQPPFETFGEVLNHEVIATEIVRTFVGSIGLALTVPLSTFLAAHFYVKKAEPKNQRIEGENAV